MVIFGRGTGILPVSCLFLGVELASCQFHAYFRAGRMPTLWVELASCQFHAYFRAWNWHLASFMLIFGRAGCPLFGWNWHLASFMLIFGRGTGILPVSCLFLGGQDAHSTAIDSKTGKLAYSTGATRGELNS